MNPPWACIIGLFASFLSAPTLSSQEFCPLPLQQEADGHWIYPGIPTLIEQEFDSAGIFGNEGLAIVRNGKEWSAIDTTGKIVIPHDGNASAVALVRANPEYFFVHHANGQARLIPLGDGASVPWPVNLRIPLGSSAQTTAPLIASVRDDGAVGYFNYKTAKFLEFPDAEQALPFQGNSAVVRVLRGGEKRIVLISYRPERDDWEIQRQDTLSISNGEGDVMPIQLSDEHKKWILFNARTKKEVAIQRVDEIAYIYPISEGLAPFRAVTYRFGAINERGEWVIPPIYRDFRGFSQGAAAVMKEDGSCGYIGVDGEELTRFDFTHTRSPHMGWVYVSRVDLRRTEGVYRFPKQHELTIARFSDLLLKEAR